MDVPVKVTIWSPPLLSTSRVLVYRPIAVGEKVTLTDTSAPGAMVSPPAGAPEVRKGDARLVDAGDRQRRRAVVEETDLLARLPPGGMPPKLMPLVVTPRLGPFTSPVAESGTWAVPFSWW